MLTVVLTMRRDTLRPPACIAVLTAVVLAGFAIPPASPDERSTAPEFPAGLGEAYRTLSESIRTENMPVFMKLFHLDFIYESTAGAGLDRGPWRRLWLERFEERKYSRMAFAAEEILEEEEDRVVIAVRRVAVVESAADGSRHLDETVFEDTWVRSATAWALLLRTEKEIRSQGALVEAAGGTISSPSVAVLAAALRGGDTGAVAAFWRDIRKSGAPLVEPVPGDPTHRRVTFLWRGQGKETSVRVRGGLPATERSKPLTRLGETDVWYLSERLPANARFTYEFHWATAVEIPGSGKRAAEVAAVRSTGADPLNRRSIDGASLVEMPEAPVVSWTTSVNGQPRGAVKRQTLSSEVLGERRFVSVYTPPGYDRLTAPCAAAFVLDSGTYKSRRVTGTVLDNLLAAKKMPPTVVFMVHGEGSRSAALEASSRFVRFLGEELVAWARENYRIHRHPGHCVVGGNGLGGLLAAATALRYPQVFGCVLAENGDFSRCVAASDRRSSSSKESHCVPRRLALRDKLPLRFFLAVGRLEDSSVLDSNRHLRDVLEAKGYSTTFRTVVANQHATTWQDALARGLTVLLSR